MRNFYLVFKNRIAEAKISASVMRKLDEEKSASPMQKFESPLIQAGHLIFFF